MQNRRNLWDLFRRAWHKTGGQIRLEDDSQSLPIQGGSDEEWDDPIEPMPLWIAALYGTIAVAVVVAIAAWILRNYSERYTYIQTVVLTLTLVVVTIYTNLTRRMQQAMVQQTNVNILPIFEVAIRIKGEKISKSSYGGGYVNSQLEIKNVGQGTALNVHIESLFVDCQGVYGGSNYQPVKFEKIFSLAPGEPRVVQDIQPYDVDEVRIHPDPGRPDLLKLIAQGRTVPRPEMKVWFTDMLGNKYVQVIHLSKSGIWSDAIQADKGQIRRTRITYNNVSST